MTPPAAQTPAGGLLTPIQYVKGIGPKRAELLAKKGLHTVEDALFFVPLRHEDRTQFTPLASLRDGEAYTCRGTVVRIMPPPRGRPGAPGVVTLRDGSGFGNVVFFRGAWIARAFTQGQQVIVHGRVGRYRGMPVIQHPDWEVDVRSRSAAAARGEPDIVDVRSRSAVAARREPDTDPAGEDERVHAGRFVPVYSLTEGLGQRVLRGLMWRIVETYAGEVGEILPEALRARRRLADRARAVRDFHFPADDAAFAAARRRLVFDDFVLLQLGFAILRSRVRRARGIVMDPSGALAARLRASLPWTLTGAQERVWDEIRSDMATAAPMHRLLQGDVGSGKTIVAALAVLTAIEAGYQAAVMAPTEILAEQHAMTFRQLLEPLGVPVTLLTSSLTTKERTARRAAVAAGETPCVVGTHALVQEGVEFRRLGLAVVDEQHRFGVQQRARLKALGREPDVLVMTATPIPRTLALTLHGDLDVSVLDELPPGRKPVITRGRTDGRRAQIYAFLRDEIRAGRQAYVVYPLIEESETLDLKAATEMAKRLAGEVFPEFTVGLLHGRLGFDDKEAIMRRFKAGEIQVLVSTTVIEVGIDVPNASVMLIEHAERFGLAQLHQLRGRVGRGPWSSYCILLTGGTLGDEAQKRIDAMVGTNDGFRIAEVDLEIRGPGDFFGTRQSGLPEFRVANLIRDAAVLEEARQDALAIVSRDADLRDPAHRGLRTELLARWRGKLALAAVG